MRSYCRQLEEALAENGPRAWAEPAGWLARRYLLEKPHGDLAEWSRSLEQLPSGPAEVDTAADTIAIGRPGVLPAAERERLEQGLRGLMPWRKGPFRFFDMEVDTEWRSDWKWQRIVPHLSDLTGRRVLDVGCGSGYHCWRMHGAGARLVLGVDPGILFFMQYQAVRRYVPDAPVWYLPGRLEELPGEADFFDTVFSLGVLYHRRSPLDHLVQLKQALRPGGELVLETLVIEGDAQTLLMPEGRYAAMRNVWFLPSPPMLEIWLRRCGFTDVRVVDVTRTRVDEQRATDWMQFRSLADFLDPEDANRTREGYPGPVRATIMARRPD